MVSQRAAKGYATEMECQGRGLALFNPSPGRRGPVLNESQLNPTVEIGDVGHILEGAFCLLFNIHRAPNDRQIYGVPDGFQRLERDDNQISLRVRGPLPEPQLLRSSSHVTAQLSASANAAGVGGASTSFEFDHERGAALVYFDRHEERKAMNIDHYKSYFRKHYSSWLSFAATLGRGLAVEDLVLVTGCEHTHAWVTLWRETRSVGGSIGLDVPMTVGAGVSLSGSVHVRSGRNVHSLSGPWSAELVLSATEDPRSQQSAAIADFSHTTPPTAPVTVHTYPRSADQCIFIRRVQGFKPVKGIPAILKAAAGPDVLPPRDRDLADAPAVRADWDEEESLELLEVPGSPNRSDNVLSLALRTVADQYAPICDNDILVMHDSELLPYLPMSEDTHTKWDSLAEAQVYLETGFRASLPPSSLRRTESGWAQCDEQVPGGIEPRHAAASKSPDPPSPFLSSLPSLPLSRSQHLQAESLKSPFPSPPSPKDAGDILQNEPRSQSSFALAERTCEMICYLWFSEADDFSGSSRQLPPDLPFFAHGSGNTAFLQFSVSSTFIDFMHKLLRTTQVSESLIVLSLHYIYRLKARHSSAIPSAGSEYRVAVAGLMMANKFVDDNTYTNKTWSEVSGMDLTDVNRMEREFLSGLDYELYLDQQTFETWVNLLKGLVLSQYRDNQSFCRRRKTQVMVDARFAPRAPAHDLSMMRRARSLSPVRHTTGPPSSRRSQYTPAMRTTAQARPTSHLDTNRASNDVFSPISVSSHLDESAKLPSLAHDTPQTISIPSPMTPSLETPPQVADIQPSGLSSGPSSTWHVDEASPQTLVAAYRLDPNKLVSEPRNLYFYALAAGSPLHEKKRYHKGQLHVDQPPPYFPSVPHHQHATPFTHYDVLPPPPPLLPPSSFRSEPAQQGAAYGGHPVAVPSAPFANAGPSGVFYTVSDYAPPQLLRQYDPPAPRGRRRCISVGPVM